MSNNTMVAHIEALNKKAQELNFERQRNLGAVEQSKKRYEEGVQAYAQKYGVQLDPSNLTAEYEKIKAELEQQATALEKQIEYIESGAYKSVPNETPVSVVGTDGNTLGNAPISPANNTGVVSPNVAENASVGVSVAPTAVPNSAPAPTPTFNGFGGAVVNAVPNNGLSPVQGTVTFGAPVNTAPQEAVPPVAPPVGFGVPTDAGGANAQMASILAGGKFGG